MSIHFKGRRGVCDARGRAPPAFYPARRSLRWAIPDAPGRPYPDSYAANAPAVPGRSGETGSPCRGGLDIIGAVPVHQVKAVLGHAPELMHVRRGVAGKAAVLSLHLSHLRP